MMRSLYSGVSGLKVHTTRMDVIGNNIANINTIGYKSSRTTFSDMLSQIQSSAAAPTDNLGGVNAKQIGLGVNVESIDLIFTDSSPQQTGKNTDLALTGNGLFALKNGNQSYYTRNGAFAFDESGYYVMPGNGLRVQGWNATSEGIINTNGTAEDIVVPVGKTMEATATTTIDYSGNLNKESLTIKSIDVNAAVGGDATLVTTNDGAAKPSYTSVNVDKTNVMSAKITLSDDTTMTVTSGYYEVGKSVPVTTLATVYDSLGGIHEVTLLIDKDNTTIDNNLTKDDALMTATLLDADGNKIDYDTLTATRDGNNNITGYTYTTTTTDDNGNPTTTEGTATLDQVIFYNRWRVYIAPGVGEKGPADDDSFTNSYTRSEANGNPESDGSSTTGKMNNVNFIYFDSTGRFISNGQKNPGSINFTYGDGNGAEEQNATIDFTGMTQYANSTTSFPITNGNTAGILQSIAIDGNGIINGTYTNGLVRQEAQIAVAQFNNSSGLSKVGTTIYTESNNSGAANIKTVADFGLSVTSSALEMSNVDLATEFADMIVTQRGFQANSKITTVSDEMLETLVNMKR